jgi:hypothetical protein
MSLYLNLLKFSLKNPKRGLQILESAYQSKEDKQHLHVYDNERVEFRQSLSGLFPSLNVPFEEFVQNTNSLRNHLEEFQKKMEMKKFPSIEKPYPTDYSLEEQSGMFLYSLCRIVKPEIIVETGVAYGRSSSYILQALKDNKKGKLYSIDFTFRPWESKSMIGSAIPKNLRDRWEFIFGPSSKKLKPVLNKLEKIDIFLHDSLHTFKNMMFEFQTAWPFIKDNGFLLSDDILGNAAFFDFYSKFGGQPTVLSQGGKSAMGILQKVQ